MRIYGIDFTCAPGPRKPITVAACELDGDRLVLADLLRLRTLDHFERALAEPGPWVAAMDFPFGLPRSVVRGLGWPPAWSDYVEHAASLGKAGYEQALTEHRRSQPAGRRHPLRVTDRLARGQSPVMLHGVPLAKMFFAGAPRLLRSPLSILPCRPTTDPRVVLEAYPGCAARKLLLARRGYKGEGRTRQTPAQRQGRAELLEALTGRRVRGVYELGVEINRFRRDQLLDDAQGDLVDALLAAVQAAWACRRRECNWGLPVACDPAEGWIADPACLRA
ncbi:MAG TPA: DUF429 domain-containing protein [Thermoanaerobaculia bacterium]|nr:DUF429 domain-containing protein [Thermoanaerobaculia bacterium]